MLRKLSRDLGDLQKIQIKLLEIKTTACETKNILDGINQRLDIAEENISELGDIAIKNYEKCNTELKENLKK